MARKASIRHWYSNKKIIVDKDKVRVRVVKNYSFDWVGYIGKYVQMTFWGDTGGTMKAEEWLKNKKRAGWKISRRSEVRPKVK